jgi:hypothetical protein
MESVILGREWLEEYISVLPFPFRREDSLLQIKVATQTSAGLQVLPHRRITGYAAFRFDPPRDSSRIIG